MSIAWSMIQVHKAINSKYMVRERHNRPLSLVQFSNFSYNNKFLTSHHVAVQTASLQLWIPFLSCPFSLKTSTSSVRTIELPSSKI